MSKSNKGTIHTQDRPERTQAPTPQPTPSAGQTPAPTPSTASPTTSAPTPAGTPVATTINSPTSTPTVAVTVETPTGTPTFLSNSPTAFPSGAEITPVPTPSGTVFVSNSTPTFFPTSAPSFNATTNATQSSGILDFVTYYPVSSTGIAVGTAALAGTAGIVGAEALAGGLGAFAAAGAVVNPLGATIAAGLLAIATGVAAKMAYDASLQTEPSDSNERRKLRGSDSVKKSYFSFPGVGAEAIPFNGDTDALLAEYGLTHEDLESFAPNNAESYRNMMLGTSPNPDFEPSNNYDIWTNYEPNFTAPSWSEFCSKEEEPTKGSRIKLAVVTIPAANVLAFVSAVSAVATIAGAAVVAKSISDHKKTAKGIADAFLNHFQNNRLDGITATINNSVIAVPGAAAAAEAEAAAEAKAAGYPLLKKCLEENVTRNLSGLLTDKALSRLEQSIEMEVVNRVLDVASWRKTGARSKDATLEQKAALIQAISNDMERRKNTLLAGAEARAAAAAAIVENGGSSGRNSNESLFSPLRSASSDDGSNPEAGYAPGYAPGGGGAGSSSALPGAGAAGDRNSFGTSAATRWRSEFLSPPEGAETDAARTISEARAAALLRSDAAIGVGSSSSAVTAKAASEAQWRQGFVDEAERRRERTTLITDATGVVSDLVVIGEREVVAAADTSGLDAAISVGAGSSTAIANAGGRYSIEDEGEEEVEDLNFPLVRAATASSGAALHAACAAGASDEEKEEEEEREAAPTGSPSTGVSRTYASALRVSLGQGQGQS